MFEIIINYTLLGVYRCIFFTIFAFTPPKFNTAHKAEKIKFFAINPLKPYKLC